MPEHIKDCNEIKDCNPAKPALGTSPSGGFIPAHGGYKKLLSYQKAEIVYDATVYFCGRFLEMRGPSCSRTSRSV